MPLKILTRQEWGAVVAKSTTPMVHPIKGVIFTYVECRDVEDLPIVKKAQLLHMDAKGRDDIECSFVIGRDGTVYEGRGWFCQPAEHEQAGRNYLDIGFISQLKGKPNHDPSVAAMMDLLRFGIENKYLDDDYEIFGDEGNDTTQAEEENSDDDTSSIMSELMRGAM